MKVSGFTFLRNAVIGGYPFLESIRSALPLVDEFVVALGPCDDDTEETLRLLDDRKVRIVPTLWNENMTDRGFVYGQQKMIAQFNCCGDWVFYLEADEVIREDQEEAIHNAMLSNLHDDECEALYFDFIHFYGSPNQFGIAGYRQAPRILKNNLRAVAPDGLFWIILERNKKGRYPKAKSAGAQIFHYGHCRNIKSMNEKLSRVRRYWGAEHREFHSYGNIDSAELRDFEQQHPKVMSRWLADKAESYFRVDDTYKISTRDFRNRIRFWLEETFNLELSKKHFYPLDRTRWRRKK